MLPRPVPSVVVRFADVVKFERNVMWHLTEGITISGLLDLRLASMV